MWWGLVFYSVCLDPHDQLHTLSVLRKGAGAELSCVKLSSPNLQQHFLLSGTEGKQ